jgi:hypothetical protein
MTGTPVTNIPDNSQATLKGRVVLFDRVQDDPKFRSLQGCVLLISDVEPQSDIVFGVIINQSWKQSFYKYMKSQDTSLTDAFRFVQMFDAAQDGFEPMKSNHAGFLTHKNNAHLLPAPEIFDRYALHISDSTQEAKALADTLIARKDILLLYSQFMLPLEDFTALAKKGLIQIRESDPDVIFNSSAYMRGALSFPEYFMPETGAPQPKP